MLQDSLTCVSGISQLLELLLTSSLHETSAWTHCSFPCQLQLFVGIIWGCACGTRQTASYLSSCWTTGVLALASWLSAYRRTNGMATDAGICTGRAGRVDCICGTLATPLSHCRRGQPAQGKNPVAQHMASMHVVLIT